MCFVFREKQKLASLKETYTQLQRSYQHQEKDLGKRKEREVELLALTEKLSSANAELQAARSSLESKVCDTLTHTLFSHMLCVGSCIDGGGYCSEDHTLSGSGCQEEGRDRAG